MKPTTIRTRWTDADADIRMQIGALHGKSGMQMQMIAAKLDISPATLYKRIQRPATFTLMELRRLTELCEAHGVPFDAAIRSAAKA